MAKLDWDSVLNAEEIKIEEPEYLTLEEGDYKFAVDDFTYDEYKGGEKIPACPMARLKAVIETDKGNAYASYTFFLYEGTGVENVYRVLKSIGLDGDGQTFGKLFKKAVEESMQGIAHIKPNEYNCKTYNNIVYFKYESEEKAEEKPKSKWSL